MRDPRRSLTGTTAFGVRGAPLSDAFQSVRWQLHASGVDLLKGLTNPRWLLMRHAGRFNCIRSLVSSLSARSSHSSTSTGSTLFSSEIEHDVVLRSLRDDGLYVGIQLSSATTAEILEFARNSLLYGNRNSRFAFHYGGKEQAQARYGNSFQVASVCNTVHCPAITQLRNDQELLAIAAAYLGTDPVNQGTQLWWSFAEDVRGSGPRRPSQLFHYDLDDYRFIKFFFYLTEVDSGGGPHVCVRGSHERKKPSHKWFRRPRHDKDIIDYYGADSVVTICGKAGFGFVEDAFAIHKGTPPLQRDRLLLTLSYATHDYGMERDRGDASAPIL